MVCAIGCVQLGAFDVSICIIKPTSVEKKPRQGIINPKQVVVPVERGRNSKGHLEMVDGLLSLALGSVYISENTMRFVDAILLACLWEETDCTGYSLFCPIPITNRVCSNTTPAPSCHQVARKSSKLLVLVVLLPWGGLLADSRQIDASVSERLHSHSPAPSRASKCE